MATPRRPRPPAPDPGHGLVLVRGQAQASARWLRRGLVAAAVVPLPGWTGVVLTEERARSQAPYDVGLEVLAARPTPRGSRPSIGLFVLDGRAVVTVQPRGWRADQRWLIWEPGVGVRRMPDLRVLPAALIVQVSGAARRGVSAADVGAHFREVDGIPLERLVGLLRLLGLPGEDLLRHGPLAGAATVEPSAQAVRVFDVLAASEDMEEQS